jgi:hypothetical protein
MVSALLVFLSVLAGPTPPVQNKSDEQSATAVLRAARTRFHADARLDRPLEISPAEVKCRVIWKQIVRAAGVPLESEPAALELDDGDVQVGGRASARAYMDAVAAYYRARWEALPTAGYRLLTGEHEPDSVYTPKGVHERARFAAGLEAIAALEKMTPAERAGIEMDTVERMLTAMNRQLEDLKGSPFPVHRLNEAEFRLERKDAPGFHRYMAGVRLRGEQSTNWRFNDYEQKKAERQRRDIERLRRGELLDTYVTARSEIGRQELEKRPELLKVVSLMTKQVSLPVAIRLLYEQTGVPFVSPPEQHLPKRMDVNLPEMPLYQALDRLMEQYKAADWEWRSMGFIVVRIMPNPVPDAPAAQPPQKP